MTDKIYYNVNLYNDTDEFKDMRSIQLDLPYPIVKNASDYYLSVQRFDIPNQYSNCFKFEDNTYQFTMSANGNDYTQYVVYEDVSVESDKYIYNPAQFVSMINTALDTLYTTMSTAEGGAVTTTHPPVLFYDDDTHKLTFCIPTTGYNVGIAGNGGGAGVELWLNFDIYRFFGTYTNFYLNRTQDQDVTSVDKYARLIVEDGKRLDINAVGGTYNGKIYSPVLFAAVEYYLCEQDISSISLWHENYKIEISSTTLKTAPEFNSTMLMSDPGSPLKQNPILTDFELNADSSSRSILQYVTDYPRRLSMISDSDVTRVHIDLSLVNRRGDIRSLKIAPKSNLTMKLLFERKDSI